MSKFILGTAGHIDHGKTSLVKALTGIDSDRLAEEKKRGISIELGFAYADFGPLGRIGIVDVPGHEKFIKNMLAGITGIDLVLVIIAADEGVMPQTKEHLDIVNLLEIRDAIFVVTKKDLVDDETLEFTMSEIEEYISDTPLAGSEMIAVSSHTGENIDALKGLIVNKGLVMAKNEGGDSPRLDVDRVFSIKGFGTVVTGTLHGGSLSIDEKVVCLPGGDEYKVKNIEVHGENVDVVRGPSRVAVNLQGAKKEDIDRGDTITLPGMHKPVKSAYVSLKMVGRTEREIRNLSVVRIYVHTKEIMARVKYLDIEALAKGEEGVALLTFDDEVVVDTGDLFIVRFYSPLETIAGGRVILPGATKSRVSKEILAKKIRRASSLEKQDVLSLRVFIERDGLDVKEAEGENLSDYITVGDRIFDRQNLDALTSRLLKGLKKFHDENRYNLGVPVSEVGSRFLPGKTSRFVAELLQVMSDEELIEVSDGKIAVKGNKPSLSQKELETEMKILEMFKESKFKPPGEKEIFERFGKAGLDILGLLVEKSEIIKVNYEIYFEKGCYFNLKKVIIDYIKENGHISIKDMKTLGDITRKYSVPFLEHLDSIGVTERLGDTRIINTKGRVYGEDTNC